LRKRDNWEDLEVDKRIVLSGSYKKLDREMGGIDLAQHRERWRALENVAVNLRGQ